MKKFLSIIIPTYNNASMLATTLSTFESIYFPEDSEMIVVDNNSKDDTASKIKSFSARLPIKYAFEPKQGISAAKNRGIRTASGELLIFTDDDVRPCKDWLIAYMNAYDQNPGDFYWGGPIISEFEGLVPKDSLLRFAPPSVKGLDFGSSQRLLEPNEWFVSANIAIPSNAISKIGGFDTTLGLDPTSNSEIVGEESDLQRRLKAYGYKAMYLPSASIRHVVPSRKCTLAHIAARAEATGRYLKKITPEEQGTGTFRGVPLWRYRKCAERWAIAMAKRFTRRDWYSEYISFKADLGFILGRSKHN